MILVVVDRIAGLSWRIHTEGDIDNNRFFTRLGTDLPLYCFTIISLALWLQWHYLYCILDDFSHALDVLESKFHLKVLVIVTSFLTVFVAVESIFVHKDTAEEEED